MIHRVVTFYLNCFFPCTVELTETKAKALVFFVCDSNESLAMLRSTSHECECYRFLYVIFTHFKQLRQHHACIHSCWLSTGMGPFSVTCVTIAVETSLTPSRSRENTVHNILYSRNLFHTGSAEL